MPNLTQPDIIFTHENDLDGFASGCLLQQLTQILYNTTTKLEPLPANPWHNLKHFPKHAWVSDLAPHPQIDRPGWTIIDHHTTPKKPQKALHIHHPNQSATQLAYNLLTQHNGANPTLQHLTHLTNIADLYQTNHPDFPLAADYARLIKTYHFRPLYRLIDSQLQNLHNHPLLKLMQHKRQIEDPIGLQWSQSRITPITPQIAYIPTTIGDTNHIVHQILQQPNQPYHTLITLHKKPGAPITASLRSNNGQALLIAQQLHGGGHPNAAGATLPKTINSFHNAATYLKQTLNPQNQPTNQPTPNNPTDAAKNLFKNAGF